ncbi:hypothetical protein TKK_0015660 [Trichogramma kaykai]
MNDYDSIDWSLNTATLILQKHANHLKSLSSKEPADEAESELIASKWEICNHRKAEVSRCWAKYGILLMRDSRDRLIAACQGYPSCAADDTNVKEKLNLTTHLKTKLLSMCNNIYFTGKITIKEVQGLAKNCQFTWGIAGRWKDAFNAALKEYAP